MTNAILKSAQEIEARRARMEQQGYPVNKKQLAEELGIGGNIDSGRVMVSRALHGHDHAPSVLERIDAHLDAIERKTAA